MRPLCTLLVLVAACSSQAPAPKVHNKSREDLVAMHDQYFAKMGLSEQARAEMRGLVGGFYDKIGAQGAPLKRTKGRKFSSKEDWLQTHEGYFRALGISESTRTELARAMSSLYDKMKTDPNDEMVVAVNKMTAEMGGMPPCCSEDSLERTKE
jgi:hypothetical protein